MSRKKLSQVSDISISPVYLSARSAIIAPERAISVTSYSLEKWLPRLGADRWSLINLLRGLSLDAPRRADGTKRVTVSWKYLSERLQVHEETIASWLKHDVIEEDKPWRRIIPVDDYAEYLSLFIPRLRYAYETQSGKTRRVGFILEVLMEDPVAPEDEIKLKQQVEQLQLQQGDLGLDTYRLTEMVNLPPSSLPDLSANVRNGVSRGQVGLPQTVNPSIQGFTTPQVNRQKTDSPSIVKQNHVGSVLPVNDDDSDLTDSKPEAVQDNVNKLNSLIEQLKSLKHRKRNYQQVLEPIITLTETLLDDYHSTAMLYKVSKTLFPDAMHIYSLAVEEALAAHAYDPTVNQGAVFVKTLRDLADQAGIDLGFRKSGSGPNQDDLPVTLSRVQSVLQPSWEEVIWSETLVALRGQMTKAMFTSVMQGTQLVAVNDDTAIVQVATEMARDWLDNRLKSIVERALSNVVGDGIAIEFKI